ncbi:hypothetical protein OCL06_12845 [Alteromonas sp. ASW11-19]|uniref:Uncharacterized protein n=1 Tax=Alteromonas salexigens TaxID=2982530 RepID=A0ABT2VTA4_9ALTE|nr:hypothetical protein [Alteromonas salexigens]MCU7555476.1 hypothetical protein [Alteromonas salexigens]
MNQHELRIEMNDGKWMVDIFTDKNDDGVFDLISPNTSTEVALAEEHMYGFRYNLSAPANTGFKIFLDDKVIAEGEVDDSGMLTGRGVL